MMGRIEVILLVLLVAGLAYRPTRKGALLVAILMVAMLFTVRVSMVRQTESREGATVLEMDTPPVPLTGGTPAAAMTAWEPSAEQMRLAPTHYSLEQAATALVSRPVISQLEISEVRLHASPRISEPIREAVLAALKTRFTGADVSLVLTDAAVQTPPPGSGVHLVLSTPQVFTRRNTGSLSEGARIRLSVIAPGNSSVEVEYQNKPWAAPGSWMDPVPGRHFALGWSTAPASTMDEAMRQAQRFAAHNLSDALVMGGEARTHFSGMSEHALRQFLEGAIRDRKLPREEFVQQFPNQGRILWRAAILVDANNQQLRSLLNRSGEPARVLPGGRAVHVSRNSKASIIGVLALILLLYFALNAWTRGFFQTRLRFLAGAVFLLVVVLVMLMA